MPVVYVLVARSITVMDMYCLCDVWFQVSHMGEKKFENPQTVNLHKVLQSALSIQDLIKDKDKEEGITPVPGRLRPVSDASTLGMCTLPLKLVLCHSVRVAFCSAAFW